MLSRIREWMIMREIKKREKESEKRFIRNAISTIEEILAEAYRRAQWEPFRSLLVLMIDVYPNGDHGISYQFIPSWKQYNKVSRMLRFEQRDG
jgi:hypothetical protein